MNSPRCRRLALAVLICSALGTAQAASFIYEGRLDDLGQPANGRYDLKLSAFGHAAHGATLAAPVTFEGVEVRDGRFRLDVELPLVKADQVWLEVAVRGSTEPAFSAIPGRSKAIAAPLVGACWSSTGDSGSDPALNFIGTTDAQPFVVRTQNVQSLRIEPSTILFAGSPITSNTIAGSSANNITAGVRGATIAGGGVPTGLSDPDFGAENPNRITDHYSTVGGGFANRAGDDAGTAVDSAFATVGGGFANTASGTRGTVGGGVGNTASAFAGTVGGGTGNTASGIGVSTVGGGDRNTASGFGSMVGGGQLNCAGGDFSWAGGRRAKVRPGTDPGGSGACGLLTYPGGDGDEGSFVWADSQAANFVSTGIDQFLVRAGGGFGFNTNTIPAGRLINTSTGAFLTTGGTWTNASSRALKTAFESIDASDVLARLLALPLTRWQYRESPAEGVHLGPVAEEFHAAFGLGADGQAISTVDANGVALAAIQGLNAKLEAENAALRAETDALRAGQQRLAAELAELRSLVRANAAER
jgi:trimeric autotransporter adhesin